MEWNELPEAVRGLFALLPPPGAVWPERKRQAWLTAMRSVIELVYPEPIAPTQIAAEAAGPTAGRTAGPTAGEGDADA